MVNVTQSLADVPRLLDESYEFAKKLIADAQEVKRKHSRDHKQTKELLLRYKNVLETLELACIKIIAQADAIGSASKLFFASERGAETDKRTQYEFKFLLERFVNPQYDDPLSGVLLYGEKYKDSYLLDIGTLVTRDQQDTTFFEEGAYRLRKDAFEKHIAAKEERQQIRRLPDQRYLSLTLGITEQEMQDFCKKIQDVASKLDDIVNMPPINDFFKGRPSLAQAHYSKYFLEMTHGKYPQFFIADKPYESTQRWFLELVLHIGWVVSRLRSEVNNVLAKDLK